MRMRNADFHFKSIDIAYVKTVGYHEWEVTDKYVDYAEKREITIIFMGRKNLFIPKEDTSQDSNPL